MAHLHTAIWGPSASVSCPRILQRVDCRDWTFCGQLLYLLSHSCLSISKTLYYYYYYYYWEKFALACVPEVVHRTHCDQAIQDLIYSNIHNATEGCYNRPKQHSAQNILIHMLKCIANDTGLFNSPTLTSHPNFIATIKPLQHIRHILLILSHRTFCTSHTLKCLFISTLYTLN